MSRLWKEVLFIGHSLRFYCSYFCPRTLFQRSLKEHAIAKRIKSYLKHLLCQSAPCQTHSTTFNQQMKDGNLNGGGRNTAQKIMLLVEGCYSGRRPLPQHDSSQANGSLPVLQGRFASQMNKMLWADKLIIKLTKRKKRVNGRHSVS